MAPVNWPLSARLTWACLAWRVKNVEAGTCINRAFVSHTSTELDASDIFDAARASAERR
jgi:hypothetical protein